MLETILIILVTAIVAFMFLASMKPDHFTVTRSATIDAPVATVFAHVNDLQKWQAWSPWARMDPEAKVTYEGPIAGEGAKFSWVGTKLGEGSMILTESKPFERIVFRLEFRKPMKAINTTEFIFVDEGKKTHVTWTMTGVNRFIGKMISMVIDCDKMAGAQFEQGLRNLNDAVKTK